VAPKINHQHSGQSGYPGWQIVVRGGGGTRWRFRLKRRVGRRGSRSRRIERVELVVRRTANSAPENCAASSSASGNAYDAKIRPHQQPAWPRRSINGTIVRATKTRPTVRLAHATPLPAGEGRKCLSTAKLLMECWRQCCQCSTTIYSCAAGRLPIVGLIRTRSVSITRRRAVGPKMPRFL